MRAQNKKTQKPKQIIVVTRDPETGEIIRTITDKKKRKKTTILKKAIKEHRRNLKETKELKKKLN